METVMGTVMGTEYQEVYSYITNIGSSIRVSPRTKNIVPPENPDAQQQFADPPLWW